MVVMKETGWSEHGRLKENVTWTSIFQVNGKILIKFTQADIAAKERDKSTLW